MTSHRCLSSLKDHLRESATVKQQRDQLVATGSYSLRPRVDDNRRKVCDVSTMSAVHQHITDSYMYQHAQATSPTATSSHVYCTKIVSKLLSQCDFLLCILLGVSLM